MTEPLNSVLVLGISVGQLDRWDYGDMEGRSVLMWALLELSPDA